MASAGYGVVSVHQADSIEDRIRLIGQQVDASQRDPWLRAVAYDIVRGGPQHGDMAEDIELAQIFGFVKSNIEYRQESRDYDYYATAKRTLENRSGDCDCHTSVVAGLASHLGFLSGAKVISPDGRNWHIYPVAGIRTKANPSAIVPLDTTQPESYPGWEPPGYQREHEILATFSGGKTYLRRLR